MIQRRRFPIRQHPSRREFLRTSMAAAAGAAIGPAMARTAHATGDETIKVALVGCGGRGTGAVTQVLGAPGPIKLWAMADLFPDQIERSLAILTRGATPRDSYEARGTFGPEQLDVSPERRFVGMDAYRQAMESGADLVLLATPPGFRPLHYAAAVAAGKHVFMEKPCCVDAPGYRMLMENNKLAEQKDLKVGVGLQRRHNLAYIDALKRIHEGALGDPLFLRAYWNCNGTWVRPRRPKETEMEYQIRNFQYFVWSGGDLIVEALVHNLDVCNWIMKGHPIEAHGVGGRQVPVDGSQGHTFDHHAVEFTYSDGVKLLSQARYIPGCWGCVAEIVQGSKGQASLSGSSGPDTYASITGPTPWQYRGPKPNAWAQEQADLVRAIRRNEKYHEGWYGATSSFTGVLGRMATYSGQLVRWDEAVAKGPSEMPEKLDLAAPPRVLPDAKGNYAAAVPGVYRAY
jgi:myo-inositol 2-dehydrogenase / D-chiro-inositol 1-dehydrogenase